MQSDITWWVHYIGDNHFFEPQHFFGQNEGKSRQTVNCQSNWKTGYSAGQQKKLSQEQNQTKEKRLRFFFNV